MIGNERNLHHSGGGSGTPYVKRDLDYVELGLEIIKAAKECNASKLQQLLDQNAPVDFSDPSHHATALHYIAAYGARPALRVVLKSAECDFLVRDREGRLPSELAREYGHDDAMARLLLIKEMRQAQAQGIDPAEPLQGFGAQSAAR